MSVWEILNFCSKNLMNSLDFRKPACLTLPDESTIKPMSARWLQTKEIKKKTRHHVDSADDYSSPNAHINQYTTWFLVIIVPFFFVMNRFSYHGIFFTTQVGSGGTTIVGFHITSLKCELQNYRSYRDFFHDVLEQLKTNIHTNVKSITFMFVSSFREKFMLL